ncbi:hypothetical protein BCR39DRAFT_559136 [Naematelia encephala]|uniref:DUF1680-domain-containing protein n=1 Tax=Naematelia encephala TaxID=71784 RepID=A0A1Y2B452_9TREE|nr:hypothetical protein BCR39DRAFT_559136 [Naematelia encephala]
MVNAEVNGNDHGHANGNTLTNGNGHSQVHANGNGHSHKASYTHRPHPQETFAATAVKPESFYGKLRYLYANQVLKTQLEQLKKQGSYDAFKLKWHPTYDIRRLTGAHPRPDGIPPSLFWESDIGKWIEAACYFLSSPDAKICTFAEEFEKSIQELVDMIEKAQQPDGYLNIYFTVVDPAGRFKNLRDMHEMYNAGHLLEGALAHYQYSGSRQFLDVMIKCIDCFIAQFGPDPSKLHGYPGHPELELAVLRLYSLTKDQKHLDFARYLLSARGVKREDQNGETYFVAEAKRREKETGGSIMEDEFDMTYNQSHLPLHDQDAILGHSVRALYLTTAAADIGGDFLQDAERLWTDCVDNKMYATGGIGTEPSIEGFSTIPHRLPQSTAEGGCYAETCASIACMMTSERLLSYHLEGKIRDIMELCLLNAVLGGVSLNGKQFNYANKQATSGKEVATRKDWFEVCCCPPNLSRTLGMIGGYTWTVNIDENEKTINLDTYLFVSASRTIQLPGGGVAKVDMKSGMPWVGNTEWTFEAPEGWKWEVKVPKPDYASDINISSTAKEIEPGFLNTSLPAKSTVSLTFSLPVRLLAPHPKTGQDTLTVSRGPIVYTAESVDNPSLDAQYPHFESLGISSSTTFSEVEETIEGIPVIMLQAEQEALAIREWDTDKAYRVVGGGKSPRSWVKTGEKVKFVPWFARANRGGVGRLRTAFLRADE